MEAFLTADGLISLITLSAMEIVLGIDNIVFIAILTGRLPAGDQEKARRLGLVLALVIRIGLLFAITWIMGLTVPLFTIAHKEFSGRSLILLAGGLFLIYKSTIEIYEKLEVAHEAPSPGKAAGMFLSVLFQILLLDIVFSLDSVITAIGMANAPPIMVAAMVIAMLVMLAVSSPIAGFVERHPSIKILALSFLLLIGVMLVAESLGNHIEKGYIYFAMAFSLFVELLNMRFRKKAKPVTLHHRFENEPQ